MSRFCALAALALLTAAAACADDPADSLGSETPRLRFAAASVAEQVMPGDVIVATVPGVDVARVAARHGLRVAERGYRARFFVLRGAVGSEHANAAALRRDASVRYAEPNYLRETTGIDPRLWAFFNPGGLNMTFTRGRYSGQYIPASYASVVDADEDNAPQDYASAKRDVVLGSIDTGVDFNHVEFKDPTTGASRLIAGRDWYNNDDDPSDDDGHGTHTTGTMIGNTVGVAGVAGVAAHVKVYVQKVCGRRGCPTSAIVNAIYAAADQPGMVAMNLSLGGTSESTAEADAIAYASSKDVLVIVSAGNSGTSTVSCPACDPNAISVAATQWQDELAPYSNSGPGLDISAPGGSCYSNTTPEGCIYSAYLGGGYEWLQGTSMAAPQVTGTAGVAAAVNMSLHGATLRARILDSTDDLGAPGYDTSFGWGRLNTYRAITRKDPSATQ